MMSATITAQRDERTTAMENAGYRWAYMFVCFGLLAITAYRSYSRHESPWDLLGLVILSGFVNLAYQGSKKVLSRQWAIASLITIVVAAGLGAFIAFFKH